MLKGIIDPTVVKDEKGNLTKSDNYKPVMQSSSLLKILERYVLNFLEERVFLNCSQFGYEEETSTCDGSFLVKEIAHKYSQQNGRMFSTFLDMRWEWLLSIE